MTTTQRFNTGPVAERVDSAVARGTLVNTVAKTAIRQVTIPATDLRVGTVINVSFTGSVIDNNAADTLALSLELKQATPALIVVGTSAALDVADADPIRGEATIVITAPTTLNSIGHSGLGATAIAAQLPVRVLAGACNLAEPMQIALWGTWSAAHADNEVQIDQLRVTITPPQE